MPHLNWSLESRIPSPGRLLLTNICRVGLLTVLLIVYSMPHLNKSLESRIPSPGRLLPPNICRVGVLTFLLIVYFLPHLNWSLESRIPSPGHLLPPNICRVGLLTVLLIAYSMPHLNWRLESKIPSPGRLLPPNICRVGLLTVLLIVILCPTWTEAWKVGFPLLVVSYPRISAGWVCLPFYLLFILCTHLNWSLESKSLSWSSPAPEYLQGGIAYRSTCYLFYALTWTEAWKVRFPLLVVSCSQIFAGWVCSPFYLLFILCPNLKWSLESRIPSPGLLLPPNIWRVGLLTILLIVYSMPSPEL